MLTCRGWNITKVACNGRSSRSGQCVISLLAVLLVGVVSPRSAPAQNAQEMSREIEALADGVRLWRLNYFRQEFKQRIVAFEIDPAVPTISVRAALGEGIWSGSRIEDIQERESAIAAWEAVEQPLGAGNLSWPGLTVVEGHLVAAPGNGPVLAIAPGGFADLIDSAPPPREAVAVLTDSLGLDLEIDAVNRRLTTGTLMLVSNPGVVRDSFLAGESRLAQAEMEFQAVDPIPPLRQDDQDPRRRISPWNASATGTSRWTSNPAAGSPVSGVFPPEWAGLIGVGDGADRLSSAFAAGQSGTLRICSTSTWQDYSTVVPLKNWLVRDGRIVVPATAPEGDPRVARVARSAIGVNRANNRLWMICAFDRDRYAQGMTQVEIAEACLALGVTDAAEGPSGGGVGASAGKIEVLPPRRVPDRCRLALVVNVETTPAPNEYRNLSRVTQVFVAGTPPLDTRNEPEKVIDGLQSPLPTLDHFWASAGTDDSPATLQFSFQKQYTIGRIDFVHAEAVGFSPDLDAAEIRIEYRAKGEERWSEWRTVANSPPRPRQYVVIDPPIQARGIRLVFTRPNLLPENKIARMAEVILWGREE